MKSLCLVSACIAVMAFSIPCNSVTINIDYADASKNPGYLSGDKGFDEPGLGPVRKVAFERAVGIFATVLDGSRPLIIGAYFDSNAGGLAAGEPSRFVNDVEGLPLSNVRYPAALATLITTTGDPDTPNNDWSSLPDGWHITISYNPDLDEPSADSHWYYGLDGNPPGEDVDFVSTTLHEMIHGFGFAPELKFDVSPYDLNGDTLLNDSFATGEWRGPPLPPGGYPDIASVNMKIVYGIDEYNFSGPQQQARRFLSLNHMEAGGLHGDYLVYFSGPLTGAATEFAGLADPFYLNGRPELFVPGPGPDYPGLVASHWSLSAAPAIMRGVTVSTYRWIQEGEEFMEDLGYSFTLPPVSGPVAWVDFDYDQAEYGTVGFPFNTVTEAAAFVTTPGTINILAGATGENVTIDQEVTLVAVNGTVTIGDVAAKGQPKK